ncbi:MAG TPA: DUF1826 domain-containing protein [Nitrospira sp.]|nr:MAG: hypothetical protein AW07_04485 [Candidatus Accumulibacter sp. SK-11]HAP39569.1 DUF1826 domain-containing protein [Nitrospira sp.]
MIVHMEEIPARAEPLHSEVGASQTVRVDDVAGLATIFEPEVQAVCWLRSEQPLIIAYVNSALAAGGLGSGFRQAVELAHRLPKLGLPDFPGCKSLSADIEFLSTLYADLLRCTTVGLRLEITDRAMCPRFHVDKTGIRLLCAYRGPGTEWIDDTRAGRDLLGTDSANEAARIAPGAEVHQAQTFDVVLLKGGLWQGNHGRGVIHRSPQPVVAKAPRLLLAIDAVWD